MVITRLLSGNSSCGFQHHFRFHYILIHTHNKKNADFLSNIIQQLGARPFTCSPCWEKGLVTTLLYRIENLENERVSWTYIERVKGGVAHRHPKEYWRSVIKFHVVTSIKMSLPPSIYVLARLGGPVDLINVKNELLDTTFQEP